MNTHTTYKHVNENCCRSPKQPLSTETVLPTSGNLIACDAITTRLTQVAEIAESLDFTLKNVQTCFEIDVSDISFDDRSLERLEMGTTIGSSDVSKILV